MEKKQTAVEWLYAKMKYTGAPTEELLKEAMEMEKQNIIDAWYDGASSDPLPTHNNALHYYEKTYGK